MLTFEQALLAMKMGKDVRWTTWPPRHFARMRTSGATVEFIRVTPQARSLYVPTQAELAGNLWSIA